MPPSDPSPVLVADGGIGRPAAALAMASAGDDRCVAGHVADRSRERATGDATECSRHEQMSLDRHCDRTVRRELDVARAVATACNHRSTA